MSSRAEIRGRPKLPVPVPSRIDTLSEYAFTTAKSSVPSPLKSPTATN